MSDPRIPRLWTLDQALIWYVTRDLELSQEADPDTKRGHRLCWADLILGDTFEGLDWRRAEADFHDLLADNRHLTKAGSSEIEEEWFNLGRFEHGDGELRLARVPGHTSEDIGRAGLNLEYLKSPRIDACGLVDFVTRLEAPSEPVSEPEPEPQVSHPTVQKRVNSADATITRALRELYPDGLRDNIAPIEVKRRLRAKLGDQHPNVVPKTVERIIKAYRDS